MKQEITKLIAQIECLRPKIIYLKRGNATYSVLRNERELAIKEEKLTKLRKRLTSLTHFKKKIVFRAEGIDNRNYLENQAVPQ